jgi:hypothetical protein
MHIKVTDRNIAVDDQAVLWAARVRFKFRPYFVVYQPVTRTGATATNGGSKQSTCPEGVFLWCWRWSAPRLFGGPISPSFSAVGVAKEESRDRRNG